MICAVGLFRQRLFHVTPETPVVLHEGRTDFVRSRPAEIEAQWKNLELLDFWEGRFLEVLSPVGSV